MEGVKFEKIKPAHEDERRALTAIFNGDLGFDVKQIKYIKVKEDSLLGDHYHPYKEFFYVLQGHSEVTLLDIETKERKVYILKEGNRLIIPPRIAHKAFIKKGTIMIEGTEIKYVHPLINDIPWEVK